MELYIPWAGTDRRELAGALGAVEPSLVACYKGTLAVHMAQSS